jgi:hypothetical protein
MKVVNIGEDSSYDVEMVPSQRPNKYGKMFQFKERIYLRKTQPTKNYDVWCNSGHMEKLVIDDTELFNELHKISLAVNKGKKGKDVLDFKLAPGRTYIKFAQSITKLPLHHELLYTIAVYGVFYQTSTKKAFLQMEVTEVGYKPITLLSHSWPDVAQGDNTDDTLW